MRKATGYFKKIDFVFFNERQIRAMVRDIRNGAVEHEANGSGISDPTAAQAIRNIIPIKTIYVNGYRLEWPESWLHVVDVVKAKCLEYNKSYLRVLDWYYKRVPYQQVCEEISVEQSTLSKMWKEVRHLQELCAVQEGLIRVF